MSQMGRIADRQLRGRKWTGSFPCSGLKNGHVMDRRVAERSAFFNPLFDDAGLGCAVLVRCLRAETR